MVRPFTTPQEYQTAVQLAETNNSEFWHQQAKEFSWFTEWSAVGPTSFADESQEWFVGATLNITVNALDRHAASYPERLALVWVPQDPQLATRTFSYKELLKEVSAAAAAFQQLAVNKGDRVCVFLPMIPETTITLLALARIGAVHVVVFAGYSAEALAQRVQDTECTVIVTATDAVRADKNIPLKEIVDQAIEVCPTVRNCIVVDGVDSANQSRELSWEKFITTGRSLPPVNPVSVQSTDPLFILHTSGSTGQPKGVVHTTGGYMVYAGYSFANIFQTQPGELFWCTADVGWITGHTYGTYGPLLQGCTILMTEGSFLFPTPARLCDIIEKYQVSVLYTAPTALRTMAQFPREIFAAYDMNSLRLLGSVGEHLDETTWHWYSQVLGKSRCPIVDTWWQTETGGIVLGTLPGTGELKPGFAGLPLPGIFPALLQNGEMVITRPWPGLAQTLYGNESKFRDTYFPNNALQYHTHDKASIDSQGYVQLLGRADDVLNVSGHRISCADLERAILTHPNIHEAAVVSRPSDVTGEEICVFVVCSISDQSAKDLHTELQTLAEQKIGRFVKLGLIFSTAELPKTRSGKILRRLLRQLVRGEESGDTSVLANPAGFEVLRIAYRNRENG